MKVTITYHKEKSVYYIDDSFFVVRWTKYSESLRLDSDPDLESEGTQFLLEKNQSQHWTINNLGELIIVTHQTGERVIEEELSKTPITGWDRLFCFFNNGVKIEFEVEA